ALVSPVRYEPYGLGVHEALCRGLPALVSTTAGVAERYPPSLRRLLLGDPESSAGVASALMEWRDHALELKGDVLAFADRLAAYGSDEMAAEIATLCDRLG
ncbi:MAG: glycosyltransferase, partial [Polyangiaceae bacterium]